jgi:hypothetical protein
MNTLICKVYDNIGFLHANVPTNNRLTDVIFFQKREEAMPCQCHVLGKEVGY